MFLGTIDVFPCYTRLPLVPEGVVGVRHVVFTLGMVACASGCWVWGVRWLTLATCSVVAGFSSAIATLRECELCLDGCDNAAKSCLYNPVQFTPNAAMTSTTPLDGDSTVSGLGGDATMNTPDSFGLFAARASYNYMADAAMVRELVCACDFD